MKTIYKYPLELTDVQKVTMPALSQILSVQVQAGEICIWAIVDTNATKEVRTFAINGTGNPFDHADFTHWGTVQIAGYVWHVFEIFNPCT